MSWYANYVVFDSPAPLRNQARMERWQEKSIGAAQYEDPFAPGNPPPPDTSQIYMRYLGPV